MSDNVSVKKFNRLRCCIQNLDMQKLVWMFFVFSVLIRTVLNGFLKHAETYMDEWLYLQQAYDAANGNGVSFAYGYYYPTPRLLYSIFLVPACLTENLQLRFYLIAFTNSLILSCAIFPVWFIARDLLQKKSTQICALLVFVTLPELNIGVTFMADVAFFALSTWIIWLVFRLVRWRVLSKKQRFLYIMLGAALAYLSMLTKPTGVLMICVMGITLLLIPLEYLFFQREVRNIQTVAKTTPTSPKYIWLGLLVLLSVVLIVLLVIKTNLIKPAFSVLNDFLSGFSTSGFKTMTLNYLLSLLLCLGILPWMFLILSLKEFRREELFQLFLLVLLTGFCLIGAIPETFGSFLIGDSDISRFIARYLFYVFVPFMIFFMAAVERKQTTGISRLFIGCVVLFCLAGFLLVWFRYPGNKLGSITDQAILFWAIDFKTNPIIAVLLIHALVALIFVMIYHPKAFLPVFMVIWLAVQGYNNVESLKIYRSAYQTNSEDSILSLRGYVSSHDEENFLLVGSVDLPDRSTRYGDTYLDQFNVCRVDPIYYNDFQNPDTGTRDSTLSGIHNAFMKTWSRYTLSPTTYDYLILSSTDASVPSGDVEHIPLGEDSWYTLYQINDTHNLPTLLSLRDIGPTEDGDSRTYTIPVNAGYFQAQRPDENGLPSFVSAGEPGYLFIGPYLKGNGNDQPTLEPGFYTITLRYQVESSEGAEGEIGYIELCGSEQEMLSEYLTPVYAGESEALIYLPVSDPIENFEMRFFANVEGVRVTEIEIIAEP